MENTSEATAVASRSDRGMSDWRKGLQFPLTFGLVSCGAIGAFLFTVTYLLEGITRPGYDAGLQPISALSLGPGGWVQQVNFVVFGVLLVLSAVGWYRLLTPGRGAIWFPLLQSISGLCLIGAGVFSMDPFPGYPPGDLLTTSTLHGTLHSIFAWVIILTLAAGCFAFALYTLHEHWHRWFVFYSLVVGVLILLFWWAFVQDASGTVSWLVPFAGLAERLSAVSHDLWICLIVLRLFLEKRRKPIHV